MKNRPFALWLILLYLAGAALLALPTLQVVTSPMYQGLLPWVGPDESQYSVRLQEALVGPPTGDASNGFWSGASTADGAYYAGMERVTGFLLGWLGWPAPFVAAILTILISPLTLVLVALLITSYSSSRVLALIGSAAYFVSMGMFRRAFHPAWSGPLVIGTILALHYWWRRPSWRNAIMAGLLLGGLPYVYLWSWTFTWAFAAILGVLALAFRASDLRWRRIQTGILLAVVALAVGSGAFWKTWTLSHNEHFAAVTERTEILSTRELESPLRSGVTILVALGVLWIFAREGRERPERWALLAGVLTSVVVMHQQLVHGRVFSFSTHYHPYISLVYASVIVAILREGWRTLFDWRKPVGIATMLAAALFPLGGLIDYGAGMDLLRAPSESTMRYQYLAPALDALESEGHQTILTDPLTGYFVAMYTPHDVAFAEHARVVMISDEEYAQRFCLTVAFDPDPTSEISELHAFLRGQPPVQQAERDELAARFDRLINESCRLVRSDIESFLQQFGVDQLLWNERLNPDSLPPTNLFQRQHQGGGWSIWKRLSAVEASAGGALPALVKIVRV